MRGRNGNGHRNGHRYWAGTGMRMWMRVWVMAVMKR